MPGGDVTGPDLAAGTSLLTVLFTDLVGSTSVLDTEGEEVAEQVRRRHFDLVGDAAADHAGTVVKSTGDGASVVFSGAATALDAAISVQQRTDGGTILWGRCVQDLRLPYEPFASVLEQLPGPPPSVPLPRSAPGRGS